MAEPKEKKPPVTARVPKKKTQGTFDNIRKLPEVHPVEELLGLSPTNQPSTHQPPTIHEPAIYQPTTNNQLTTHQPPNSQQPTNRPSARHRPSTNQPDIAPTRDFVRMPNSTIRDAIPQGIFRGTSKKLYDALYLRTRGAVVPTRKVQATQAEVMVWAAMSLNTLKSHIKHMETVGLLKREWVRGQGESTVYEVFLPEEIGLPTNQPPTTNHVPPTNLQKLGGPTTQNLVHGRQGQSIEREGNYPSPNTLSNTNKPIDDEGTETFSRFRARWAELAGVDPLAGDWEDFFISLDSECTGAISRVAVVSSLPAFLGEHLRRALVRRKAAQERSEAGKGSEVQQAQSVEGMTEQETIHFFTELITGEGYTLEDIERQFRSGFSDEEWERVLILLRAVWD